jgi:altronate hydrolase
VPGQPESPVGLMLILAPGDNVGIVMSAVPPGGLLKATSGQTVSPIDQVPQAHKVALEDLPEAAGVRKYGQLIAVTTRFVHRGEHLHVHNAESQRLRGDLVGATPAHLGANDGE